MFHPTKPSFTPMLVLTVLIFLMTSSSLTLPVRSEPGQPTTLPANEVIEMEEYFTMYDGEQLPASIFFPESDGPAGDFPLIVFIHPWMMDKSMYEVTARQYAAKGYVCAVYTARGWFGAGGSVGCMDPVNEMEDLSSIITAVSEDARFPVLSDEKGPVVGVTGYSMGGCHAFLAAPRQDPLPGDPGDPRIRAVVPMHGATDLLYSIYPNNTVKLFWTVILVAGAYGGNLTGLMMSSLNILLDKNLDAWQKLAGIVSETQKLKGLLSNVSPELSWLAAVAMQRSETDEARARQYLKVRSARYWCDQEMDGVVEHPITAPTLIIAGWQDDLFYANEGLRVFSTCMDAPSRMIVTNHGHIGGMVDDFFLEIPGTPEADWIKGEVERWFDRYLKGVDNGVEEDPRLVYYRSGDPPDYAEASGYPLAGTENVSYYLGDGAGGRADLSTAAPRYGFAWPDILVNTGVTGSVSLPYFQDATQLLGGEVMDIPARITLLEIPWSESAFTTDPLASDVEIMGAPMLEVYYQSQQRFCQLIPFLYEVTQEGEEVLVSRGYYEGWKLTPWSLNSTAGQPVEMQAVYHRFRAGSRIRLEMATADLLMAWPFWGFNFILLPHGSSVPSRIVLPVVKTEE